MALPNKRLLLLILLSVLIVWLSTDSHSQSPRVLYIMPSRLVRNHLEYPRKMKRHFPIKPGQAVGMALSILIPFPNSLIRTKNWFVKNETANFGWNIPTEICGPLPEVIPNIPVRRNQNEPFHLNPNRNFRNLWHNGKHPGFFSRSFLVRFPLRCYFLSLSLQMPFP